MKTEQGVFPRFSELPADICITVWTATLSCEPRMVELVSCDASHASGNPHPERVCGVNHTLNSWNWTTMSQRWRWVSSDCCSNNGNTLSAEAEDVHVARLMLIATPKELSTFIRTRTAGIFSLYRYLRLTARHATKSNVLEY